MSNTGWPLYMDASVRDYGPLRTDEMAIFCLIASRAGWDGKWWPESANHMAESFADLSARAVYDIRAFLVEAQMVERRSTPGHRDEFRPRRTEHWVHPEQLVLIRKRVYRNRNKKLEPAAAELSNVTVLSIAAKEIHREEGPQKQQTSLTSVSRVSEFQVTDEMREWAEEHCAQVVDQMAATVRFIEHQKTKIKDGYDITNVDLCAEWKKWMRRAQAFAEQGIQKGMGNASRFARSQQADEANGRGYAGGSPRAVARFGTKQGGR